MAEKLCLQWNNYKENIRTSLGSLREAPDFTDVTLACEDGKQIEAHKIILACLSPFFGELLRKNRSSHPLIYLRGFKSEDMTAIVAFNPHHFKQVSSYSTLKPGPEETRY